MKNEQTWINNIFKFGVAENKRGNKVISASQIGKYLSCPRQWSLRYIHKHREDKPSIHLVFGNAMHEVIQEWLKIMYSKTIKASEALPLETMLKNKIREIYVADMQKYGKHFSKPEELAEFYADGVAILKYLKSKRSAYFSTRKIKLVAIELPLLYSPNEDIENVKFMGFLDLVFYDETDNTYLIVDLKTSTRGWNDKKKKDKNTTDQILLYKRYMSKQFGIPENKINVEYLILRRKINPDSMWPMKRVQSFKPSNGKPSVNKAERKTLKFVSEVFNDDGTYNTEREYPAVKGVSGYNCTFCPYKEREDLCPSKERVTSCLKLG